MPSTRFLHNVYAEIDLPAVTENLAALRKLLRPGTKVMAVVKADGYGHGAVEIARRLMLEKVDFLGVANFSEALELRDKGITLPILILSEIPHEVVPYSLGYKLSQTVYSMELARDLSEVACTHRTMARVHVKVDTGMGRVGIPYTEAAAFIKELTKLPHLSLEGIFTHFAKADDPRSPYTLQQLKRFTSVISQLKKAGIGIPLSHAANSGGVIFFPATCLDMVRIGLSLYGLYPSAAAHKKVRLKPVLTLKTRVAHLKVVSKGEALGYGGTYRTQKDTRIATLPVGYADGLPRTLSNRGVALIRGQRYPIVGRISMDLTLVEVGGHAPVARGDEVVLIGRQGKAHISADEVARLEGTINYEVVCRIGRRVPRVYKT